MSKRHFIIKYGITLILLQILTTIDKSLTFNNTYSYGIYIVYFSYVSSQQGVQEMGKLYVFVLLFVFACGCTSQTKSLASNVAVTDVEDPLRHKCDSCRCRKGILYGSDGKPIKLPDGVSVTCLEKKKDKLTP